MKLTVLGSGSAVADSKRAATGYLVELSQHKILLDLGFGCFKNLQKVANPLEISAVCFSHYYHPDHFSDLLAFLMYRRGSVMRGAEPKQVTLFGPKGLKAFYEGVVKAMPYFENSPFPVKITELENSQFKIFNFSIKTKPVQHMGLSAIGFRIESGGKALAYSGDTGYTDAMIELGKEADLLILECSVTDNKKMDDHLSPSECAELASKAKAKALMVSHFFPETETIDFKTVLAGKYSGKILKAEDLMKVEV
ncbi:MAG: MBL fold metallo-hydrolase [Candidatus Diapherotrites archaeon]|nr:MBL fold metallo-hydrolase [Candidatus Diapherotrites archaeon]